MTIKERLLKVANVAVSEPERSKHIARALFKEVKEIEDKLEQSVEIAREIEARGIWGNLTASPGKDLVRVAKAQNAINNEMFGLIQETISLNVLSYAGLAGLLDELRQCIEHGLVDANGKVIRLSSEGRELADTAANILTGILDGAKGTQDSISLNAEQIDHLRMELEQKSQLDSQQDQAIARLEAQVMALAKQVIELQDGLRNARDTAAHRIGHLEQRHSRWRYATIAIGLVPMIWLASTAWF
jgi:hypothetical protein